MGPFFFFSPVDFCVGFEQNVFCERNEHIVFLEKKVSVYNKDVDDMVMFAWLFVRNLPMYSSI